MPHTKSPAAPAAFAAYVNLPTSTEPLSAELIAAFRVDAASHGDDGAVALCDIASGAVDGDMVGMTAYDQHDARVMVADMINEARAEAADGGEWVGVVPAADETEDPKD